MKLHFFENQNYWFTSAQKSLLFRTAGVLAKNLGVFQKHAGAAAFSPTVISASDSETTMHGVRFVNFKNTARIINEAAP